VIFSHPSSGGISLNVPMLRAEVSPNLFRWARDRAGIPLAALTPRFSKLAEWESGTSKPTLKQLEALAKATLTPVGYFFLPEPPVERLPLPDFRTVRDTPLSRPSPNLLAMVYACQERQSWYREFAATAGVEPCPFVGSVTTSSPVVEVAERMRKTLNFDLDRRNDSPTWTEALRDFIGQAEAAGVLVMCSGVVLNNNGRPLDPDEFRGFTIADALAPLVFINGADTKAAQTFTLAHELAHLWIGQSGVTDATIRQVPSRQTERWCNQVAAEFLVPLAVLRADYQKSSQLDREVSRLSRRFKVSSLVILRRIHDAGFISKPVFAEAFDAELDRLRERAKGSGGNFYLTQAVRASKRFTRALLASTLEGQTLYRDAMRLLGVSKVETLHKLGHSLSVE
jgi:Zn-dependent peptidase ImmA (M78 family)/transcriptional regulator with XRE-family HTH domain